MDYEVESSRRLVAVLVLRSGFAAVCGVWRALEALDAALRGADEVARVGEMDEPVASVHAEGGRGLGLRWCSGRVATV